jgi:hypothetical protein
VTFSDTFKLDTKVPPNSIFTKEKYEGLVDRNVFIGSGRIDWEEGGHDAEVEWVLIFDRPITEITFTDNTECTLQGMIEGKNLARLLGDKEIPWEPASIGNNVIATMDITGQEITGGIPNITLNDLTRNNSLAIMRLSFEKEDGGILPTREVSSTELRDVPIVELLKELAGKAQEYGLADCCAVNLGANGKNSAYVNNTLYKREAFFKEMFSISGLFANLKHGINGITDRVRDELIKELIDDKRGMKQGGEARLQVFNSKEKLIGEAVLKTV